MSAVTALEIPAIPTPTTNLNASRMYSWMSLPPSMRYPTAPAAVNTTSDVARTLTFPSLSARAPMAKPTTATAREGMVMIMDTRVSCPGNTCSMSGRAGATAAPPISMSIEQSNMVRSVSLVGVNCLTSCMSSSKWGCIHSLAFKLKDGTRLKPGKTATDAAGCWIQACAATAAALALR